MYRGWVSVRWRVGLRFCILDPVMRLSLQVHYAICGVFDLAYNGQSAPVQVRVIGDRQRIPARYLEQIFQRPRQAGLVHGKRGPGGGYTLARAAGEITVRDIVEALEGPITMGDRLEDDESLSKNGGVSYRPDFLWSDLASRFADALAQTTVEALCRQAAQQAVPHSDADAFVYHI